MIRDSVRLNNFSDKFKKFNFIHGLLQYPHWTSDADLFGNISEENLIKLQNKEIFFIFDASTEGFSPVNHFPFFNVLYFNCEKYNVDPSMVIYVSSNLCDERNIIEYCKSRNKKPIHVFSFLSFEKVVRDPTLTLPKEKEHCSTHFTDKYFSSLSRVIRYHRSIATFLLCHSDISDKALISHANFGKDINVESWRETHQLTDFTVKEIRRWMKRLPLTIDKSDFKTNWALTNDYFVIHRKTLFQIVNETLVDNQQNTSLFYSEKTFRPVACFQPFVIYGQQGCNRHLKNIGYRTYEDWFDLSFDSEPDDILRYKKLLGSVTETCKYLDSLTKDQQIEWRFKNEEILQHNFDILSTSEYSVDKLENFLKKLDEQINNKTA
jgi:hypothetical protein